MTKLLIVYESNSLFLFLSFFCKENKQEKYNDLSCCLLRGQGGCWGYSLFYLFLFLSFFAKKINKRSTMILAVVLGEEGEGGLTWATDALNCSI